MNFDCWKLPIYNGDCYPSSNKIVVFITEVPSLLADVDWEEVRQGVLRSIESIRMDSSRYDRVSHGEPMLAFIEKQKSDKSLKEHCEKYGV